MRRSGADCSVVAGKRGNSRGAKGAGDLRGDRSGSTGNRRNPLVSAEGGSLQGSYEPDKSRGLRPVLREARGAIPRAYSAAERSVPLSRSLLRQCHIDLQRDFEGWMSTPGWGNRSADFLLDKLGPDSYSEVDGSAGHQTRRVPWLAMPVESCRQMFCCCSSNCCLPHSFLKLCQGSRFGSSAASIAVWW
jgi:hypothetical protein